LVQGVSRWWNVAAKDAHVPFITWADRPSWQNQCGHALQQTHNLTDSKHTSGPVHWAAK